MANPLTAKEIDAAERALRQRVAQARVRHAEEQARRRIDRGGVRSQLPYDDWLATLSVADLEAFVVAVRKELASP